MNDRELVNVMRGMPDGRPIERSRVMTKYMDEKAAKEAVCEIGRKMFQKQFVAANDGNITIRIGENTVIATPTGVNKGDLKPEMLLTVDLDGNVLAGSMKPTSELYMHLGIYKVNPELQSTCHAHCIYLSAYAIAGLALDMAISPETSAICGTIPVAPYATPGSGELAESVKPFVKDYSIVLLANHGPMAWGRQPMQAWYILEAAEAFAKECTLIKYIIKDARLLSDSQLELLEKKTKVSMAGPRRTKAVPAETNTGPARSLTETTVPPVVLSDADIDRIADRVVEKLARK